MKATPTKKTLMILGGSRYVLPLIKTAHELGVFVITVDYLPNNIAHKYSDLFLNISVTNEEKVLEAAKRFHIDGITSFACDPGVKTMAFVSNKLGLPSVGPYESVTILQNKSLFREFLKENGFNVPKSFNYKDIKDLMTDQDKLTYPVIVKPVDSAGSKGVSKVGSEKELLKAGQLAFQNSLSKSIIVEEFIEKDGCSSDSDCYSENGKLVFASFSDQYFDESSQNPFVPSGFIWPSTMKNDKQEELIGDIQRLLTLLKMNTSIYNVEARISKNGKPYIMEVSPRGGGNRIAEMLKYSTGVDLIKKHIMDCVGLDSKDVNLKPLYHHNTAEIILHNNEDGIFESLLVKDNSSFSLLEKDLWVKTREKIESFTGANKSIGTVVLKLIKDISMEDILKNIELKAK